MSWFRVDDKFAFHAKVLQAGNAAIGVWVRLGAWCSDHLTDGKLTCAVALVIEGPDAGSLDRLCDVGLLEREGENFAMHDFLDWNPSSKTVKRQRKELSAARSKAGSKGVAKREANRKQTASPSPSPSPSPSEDLRSSPPVVPRSEFKLEPSGRKGRPAKPPKPLSESPPLSPAERATVEAIGGDATLRAIVRTPEQLARDLVKAAPRVTVSEQIPKAGAWLRANSQRRRSDGNRFLVNWMARAEEDAKARGEEPPKEPARVSAADWNPTPYPARSPHLQAKIDATAGEQIDLNRIRASLEAAMTSPSARPVLSG